MKKFSICLVAAIMAFAVLPVQLSAVTGINPTATAATKPAESEEINALNARLMEIHDMDKSNLKSSEKRKLRKEVRSIKKELKAANNGGVYLSVGAIIIIILLLILLL